MDQIDEVISRGVEKIYPDKESFEKVLRSGKKIRLYQGFDPTGPDLHIGHAVALRKLREFQKLGHHVIFLIGDFTARIGDPSGKLNTRNLLSEEEVKKNAQKYKKQAAKILDFGGDNPVEIKYNSEWLGKMSALDFLELARNLTYQQVIERDMFQDRIKTGNDIYLNEFLYPFMQGYDSVAMNVDLEIGGTDQTFNMLTGRKLMRNILKKDKFVMTVPLLQDSKGIKIGKTEGNVIGIADAPKEFYAKIMTLGDDVIVLCFTLLTDLLENEIKDIKSKLDGGENPITFKKRLAFELTKEFNSEEEAKKAQEEFEKAFQKKTPEFNKVIPARKTLAETIAPFTALGTVSDAKRLIRQGGVDVCGVGTYDPSYKLTSGQEIKIGKKTFVRVK